MKGKEGEIRGRRREDKGTLAMRDNAELMLIKNKKLRNCFVIQLFYGNFAVEIRLKSICKKQDKTE